MTASCLHASFRTTPEPSKLTMTRSTLITSLRGSSNDESHPDRRCRIELGAPPACPCCRGSPRRRIELSKFADADPFGVCAAGVVMRTVITSSYKAVNRLPHPTRRCQKKTHADVITH